MSRVAKNPVEIPKGVEVKLEENLLTVKGSKGELKQAIHDLVELVIEDSIIKFIPKSNEKASKALAGTTRSLVNNMVIGVSNGFEKKLELVGVGYRAQTKGKSLSLTLGFSHPVDHQMPEGITCETPSNTEVLVKGIDKKLVGQVAADIRSYRPPEPYKGKGVKYADEIIRRKEAKKK
ncbi:MAG: 50S ribosomal protein L6 [Pseudomonadota bacterium]